MKKALIFTSIFVVLFSSLIGFGIGVASRLALFELFFSLTPSAPFLAETNLLILGLDEANGHRSDTIMVLHVNPNKREASVVSIPRDTIVILPGRGLDKVNHAYAYGGVDLSLRTVENFLNLNIPYYVMVDLPGIEKLIDQLGGIMIDVEKRMYYVDFAQDLHIDLQPGLQRLSGRQAMGYLRFRHTDNDFARIGRQQKFLRAMADELMRREKILASPGIFFSMLGCVSTNLNSREILGLSLALRGANESGQVYMSMIPGSDMMVDGIYYWKPDSAAVQKIVDQLFLGKRLASSG